MFFGCWRNAGHYLHEPGGRSIRYEAAGPWGTKLDGRVQPEEQVACIGNGLPPMRLIHKDGWTSLGFWDRTVDTRPGSCAAFVSTGTHTEEAMVKLAKEHFPKVWARFYEKKDGE